MKRKIFLDESLENCLHQDGFSITKLFDDNEFAEFKLIVDSLDAEADHDDVHICTPFRLSAFNNNGDYKSVLYDRIYTALKDKIDHLLDDYEPLVVNIFEKLPNKGDDSVAIHQNPSFVAEPEFKSVSIWIPLIDVHKGNGTVGVLKGSQDVFDAVRAPNMPDVFASFATELQTKYFEPLELTTGEVAVLDDSMVHWSYPNQSNEIRKAVQLIMVPRGTEHIYYYYNTQEEQPKMDMYKVDKSFFFRFNCQAEPEGLEFIGDFPYEYKDFSESDMLAKVYGESKSEIVNKKKSWYNPVTWF